MLNEFNFAPYWLINSQNYLKLNRYLSALCETIIIIIIIIIIICHRAKPLPLGESLIAVK